MTQTAQVRYPPLELTQLKHWWSQNSQTHHPLAIKYVPECDSTNAQLYRSPSHANTLLVSELQTHGRGQFERVWQSCAGDLIFSIGLRLPMRQISALSIRVGLAIAQVCATRGYTVQLKWPNDVMLAGGKLAGILVQTLNSEDDARDDMRWVVIGVGLNIAPRNSADASTQTLAPIGLAQYDDRWLKPDVGAREALLMHLVDGILQHIDGAHIVPNQHLAKQWNAYDFWHNTHVQWTDTQEHSHHGVGLGINANGTYQLQTDMGVFAIHSGQIRAVTPYPPPESLP